MASTTAGPVSTTAMPDLGNGTNGVATTVDPFSQTFNNTEFFELFLQVGFFFCVLSLFYALLVSRPRFGNQRSASWGRDGLVEGEGGCLWINLPASCFRQDL